MSDALTFEGVTLEKIKINGQEWLRGHQIGGALDLVRPADAISKIHKRNRHQFTPDMTMTIGVQTAGGEQLARVYSPRGVALLCLLSRSPVADRFRAFVLDRLESGGAVVAACAGGMSDE